MIYITIIICTLFVCATIVAWRYFDEITSLESIYDTQLDDISIIISDAKYRHNKYLYDDTDDKYKFKHSDKELEDLFDVIYRISTRGHEPNNK